MSQRKRAQKQKKSSRKRSSKNDGVLAAPNASLRLPRTVSQIMPDRLMTRLTYKGIANFSISAAASHFARRWTPTAAYDIDPLLGSTTTVGFTEMTTLYGSYRVNRSMMTCRAANLTAATSVQLVLVPLNQDPTSSPSLATVQGWVNNPYSKVKLVPVPGGDIVSLTSVMSTEKMYGSKMVYFDDNFAANATSVPVNNWYWCVAIIAPVAAASLQTVTLEIDIYLDVEFYNRRVLLN